MHDINDGINPRVLHLWKKTLRLETFCLLFHGLYSLLYTAYFKVNKCFLQRSFEACSFLQTCTALIYRRCSSTRRTRRTIARCIHAKPSLFQVGSLSTQKLFKEQFVFLHVHKCHVATSCYFNRIYSNYIFCF